MSSKMRKPLSLVLVFVMALSIVGIAPATAKAAEEYDSVGVRVKIHAPYHEYFDNTYYDEDINLDKDDLNDDFGIGLATGNDAKFTALRAIAKFVREGLMKEKSITDKVAANELLKNYIGVTPSQYGLSLTGISDNGTTWNPGAYKESTTSADGALSPTSDGYWNFIVNGASASLGVDSYEISMRYGEEIELTWVSMLNDGNYAGTGKFNIPNSGYILSNKNTKIILMNEITTYDASYNLRLVLM